MILTIRTMVTAVTMTMDPVDETGRGDESLSGLDTALSDPIKRAGVISALGKAQAMVSTILATGVIVAGLAAKPAYGEETKGSLVQVADASRGTMRDVGRTTVGAVERAIDRNATEALLRQQGLGVIAPTLGELAEDNARRIREGKLAADDTVFGMRSIGRIKTAKDLSNIVAGGEYLKPQTFQSLTGATELTQENYAQVVRALFDTSELASWMRKWDALTKTFVPYTEAELAKIVTSRQGELERWLKRPTTFQEEENPGGFAQMISLFNAGLKTMPFPSRETLRRELVASGSIAFLTPIYSGTDTRRQELMAANGLSQMAEYVLLSGVNVPDGGVKVLIGKDESTALTYLVPSPDQIRSNPQIPPVLYGLTNHVVTGIGKSYTTAIKGLEAKVEARALDRKDAQLDQKGAQLDQKGAQLDRQMVLRDQLNVVRDEVIRLLNDMITERDPQKQGVLISEFKRNLEQFNTIKTEILGMNDSRLLAWFKTYEEVISTHRKDPRLPTLVRS